MSDNIKKRWRGRGVAAALVLCTLGAGLALAALEPGTSSPSIPLAPATSSPAVQATGAHGVHMAAVLDRTKVVKGGQGLVRAKLSLSADRRAPEAEAPATDIVVLLDASSSMSGEKFATAQRAVNGLIARLRPQDRFALVRYSGRASAAIGLTEATPVAVESWRARVAQMSPAGSTNIDHAMTVARHLVTRHRGAGRPMRVLLVSDGQPSAGNTDPQHLQQRATELAAAGAVVGSIGVGEGFNEVLMSQIADAGSGNFYSLHAEGDLEVVLAAEFEGARATVAGHLAVMLEGGEGVSLIDAAGYPITRQGGAQVFRPGTLQSGQTRVLWLTLKVPSAAAAEHALGRLELSFAQNGARKAVEIAALPTVACVEDQSAYLASIDKAVWEESVIKGRFASVEKSIGAHVREGRQKDAQAVLDTFAAETTALNRHVASAAVTKHMKVVKGRRAQLDDAFRGRDQAHKRNLFGKQNIDSGWRNSRANSFAR